MQKFINEALISNNELIGLSSWTQMLNGSMYGFSPFAIIRSILGILFLNKQKKNCCEKRQTNIFNSNKIKLFVFYFERKKTNCKSLSVHFVSLSRASTYVMKHVAWKRKSFIYLHQFFRGYHHISLDSVIHTFRRHLPSKKGPNYFIMKLLYFCFGTIVNNSTNKSCSCFYFIIFCCIFFSECHQLIFIHLCFRYEFFCSSPLHSFKKSLVKIVLSEHNATKMSNTCRIE